METVASHQVLFLLLIQYLLHYILLVMISLRFLRFSLNNLNPPNRLRILTLIPYLWAIFMISEKNGTYNISKLDVLLNVPLGFTR